MLDCSCHDAMKFDVSNDRRKSWEWDFEMMFLLYFYFYDFWVGHVGIEQDLSVHYACFILNIRGIWFLVLGHGRRDEGAFRVFGKPG